MICNALVLVTTARNLRKYNKHSLVYSGNDALPVYIANRMTEDDIQKLVRCGGKITARVSAEEEPYYGGSSSVLVTEFKCQLCGNTCHEGLPNIYNISEWSTKIIEKL